MRFRDEQNADDADQIPLRGQEKGSGNWRAPASRFIVRYADYNNEVPASRGGIPRTPASGHGQHTRQRRIVFITGDAHMLEQVDLSRKIAKPVYRAWIPILRDQLYHLQKASWDARIPVVILFEGWDAAGKGTTIQALTRRLDPRGFKLYPIRAARTYEKKRPWLWRFWRKIPAYGEWAIFDRSWYGRVLVERVEGLTPKRLWQQAYDDIVDFEHTLADDGTLICKFFLHISKKEQKRRFKKLLSDPMTAWHVAPEDWEHHRKYKKYAQAIEEMLARTETEWGPWTLVPATNRRYTRLAVFTTIIQRLAARLAAQNALPQDWQYPPDLDEMYALPVEDALHRLGVELPEETEAASKDAVPPQNAPAET